MSRSVLVHDALKDLQIVHCARGLVGGELEIKKSFNSSTKEFRLCPEDVGDDTEEFKAGQ